MPELWYVTDRETETEARDKALGRAGMTVQQQEAGEGWGAGEGHGHGGLPHLGLPLFHLYLLTLSFWDARREDCCSRAQGQPGRDEKTERRGWRETGLGRPLPASPASPGA